MQSNQRILFAGVLLLGLGWIWLSADRLGISTNGLMPAPQKGFLAPNFTLETLDGESITLSNLRGQAVIVNFWASWCGPCRMEMPAYKKVYEEYKDRGLFILAVNATSQDKRPAVEAFVAKYQLPFTILLDTEGRAARAYKINALPTTFFIGRDGVITQVVIGGPLAESLLRAEIESLFAEETP